LPLSTPPWLPGPTALFPFLSQWPVPPWDNVHNTATCSSSTSRQMSPAVVFVLLQTHFQIICHACVKNSFSRIADDVDKVVMVFHSCCLSSSPTSSFQGDKKGGGLSQKFIDTSYSLATAHASRHHPVLLVLPPKVTEQLHAQLSSGTAQRVAQGDGTAVGIQFVWVNT
jgi:hypothetical protein